MINMHARMESDGGGIDLGWNHELVQSLALRGLVSPEA